MKKIFTISIALFLFIISNAQTVKFGLKANYNLPQWDWSFSPAEFNETTKGFTLGAYLDFYIKDNSVIRGGVNLSSYELSLSSKTGLITTYLELPIFYRLEFKKDLGLFAYCGLGFGFNLVEDTYWNTSDPIINTLPVFQDYKDDYLKNTRVFVPIGLAYDFKFGLSVDLGYDWNINDMGSDKNIQFVQGFSNIHFGLGYTF